MKLAGVRRQLGEARDALAESGQHALAGRYDPAYRAALKGRNQLFHATRGLAIAGGQEPPEMPIVGGAVQGVLTDLEPALTAIEAALGVEDDLTEMPPRLTADLVKGGLARYLAWLRTEVGRVMGGGTK